ncbi:MAG: elongation factor G [Chloroflexota bacterium]|nr:elongation factor G [Chloroflexota bacterium]
MPTYSTEAIRNVVLLSHSGAGKTTISEAMLLAAGSISRLGKVESGTTVSDYEPEEAKRQISISLSILPVKWKDWKVNVIDCPGYADFIGECEAGIRVADGVAIVVCAVSGVEVGTELMWRRSEESGKPRVIFINKMDRENADFGRIVNELQEKLSKGVVPVQMPLGTHTNLKGVVDLIAWKAYSPEEVEIPDDVQEEAKSFREKLIEGLAEFDDELMMKYLDGEEISSEEIIDSLRRSVRNRDVVPVVVGSGLQNVGIPQCLDAICDYLPSPLDIGDIQVTNSQSGEQESVSPDSNASLAALVFKTGVDPYVGKITYLRVYSGTINSNSQVWNANKGQTERLGQLSTICGKTQEPISELVSGDIGCVSKLTVTSTGDTLCNQSQSMLLRAFELPKVAYSVAVYPKSKADVDKLSTALPRLLEEDSSLEMRRDVDTGEMLLAGLGDCHVEVAIDRLQRKFGVEVEARSPKVPYKETVSVETNAEYKHKKQTGGHGQYGHVLLRLEPLPRGTGFEFAEKVVGGAVPKNYIPAVEKGVTEGKQEGVLAGYPVVDVRVTLYDGSAHPVDSSEMSFKIAASHALNKGLTQGQPILLEPIAKLQVVVPDSFTGDVISDLNTKRARVLGMNPENGSQVIEVHVPQAEVMRYAIDLRSITQGRGSFVMEFSHYEEVPAHITQKIVEQKAAEKE